MSSFYTLILAFLISPQGRLTLLRQREGRECLYEIGINRSVDCKNEAKLINYDKGELKYTQFCAKLVLKNSLLKKMLSEPHDQDNMELELLEKVREN